MIFLKNCMHIQQEADVPGLSGEDLLIEGNRISKIGPNLEPPLGCKIIDASKHVVIPGLVNTHHHFYQTLTRNLPQVQDAKLFTWLVYLYKIWENLDEDAIYWSTILATAELLKTGCTLTTDHHYLYPKSVKADIMGIQFEAAQKTGIRFSPTRGSMSRSQKDGGLPPDSVVQTEEEILEDSERVIRKYHDSGDFSMSRVALAPCSPFSVSEQSMKDTAALARKHGVLLHTHLAETEDENGFCEREMGRRPLRVMEDCGFLGPDVWFAHGIHFTDDELNLLQKTGTQIAHCPASNMRLGSGICRVKEMKNLGINVALAVDGSASNDTSDMLGEVRNALLLQRVTKGADALSLKDVFRMGTENGAKLLNYKKTGKLREGWAADIAIFSLDKLEYTGSLSDPLAAIVFSGFNHQVSHTIVNGRVVVEDGMLVGVDETEIIKKGNLASARLCKGANIQ